MSRYGYFVRAIALFWLFVPASRGGQEAGPVPDSLVAAIEKAVPGASLVSLADVNAKECKPVPKTPGLVRADFDGDGRADFAVLVKAGETGKVVDWQGTRLREARYVFAIFLDDAKGGFTVRIVQRFVDFVPIASFIDLQAPGNVPGFGENPGVVIPNSGIAFVNCEKSEAVYYFSGKRIRTIWVSD